MVRIVFIGGFTPMQKILYEFKNIDQLECLGLYTNLGDNAEIEKSVKELNLDLQDVSVLKTKSGKKHLQNLKPDWVLNINSTVILTKDILNIPRFGCLNLHPGKLPEYAGLYAYQWAIRNDEKNFSVTIHWMEEKIDSGPIAYTQNFPVLPSDTGLSLFMKCMKVGAELSLEVLKDIGSGYMPPRIMQDLSKRKLYTNKDSKNGNISWLWSSKKICNFIRAVDYSPLSSPTYIPTCVLKDGRQINILKATPMRNVSRQAGEIVAVVDEGIIVGTCDKLSILITKIQLENKLIVEKKEIAKSFDVKIGEKWISTGTQNVHELGKVSV